MRRNTGTITWSTGTCPPYRQPPCEMQSGRALDRRRRRLLRRASASAPTPSVSQSTPVSASAPGNPRWCRHRVHPLPSPSFLPRSSTPPIADLHSPVLCPRPLAFLFGSLAAPCLRPSPHPFPITLLCFLRRCTISSCPISSNAIRSSYLRSTALFAFLPAIFLSPPSHSRLTLPSPRARAIILRPIPPPLDFLSFPPTFPPVRSLMFTIPSASLISPHFSFTSILPFFHAHPLATLSNHDSTDGMREGRK
ncbi:hypothetical protein DFH06DRAFT_161534 [Mycena polygramma]|nr:hypothetical protein DFH06DRAFT_161534 [Mycena polygramma]